jgi:hypothetical protein
MPESKEICTIVPIGQDGFQPRVYGMGFLVSDTDILTCAHVIDAALGANWQTGDGTVEVCFPFSEISEKGKYLTVRGRVDRDRWFPQGPPKPGEPTDIAVIVLETPAPASVKRGTLLRGDIEPGAKVQIYGFPGALTANGVLVSHPTGLYIEGQVMDELPAGRAQFQGIWDVGTTVEKGFSGAGVYDRIRDSIVGMVVRADLNKETKIAEFIGAPSLQFARGAPKVAAGAESIQNARTIPAWLFEQTVDKRLEIEAKLKTVGAILPAPNPVGGLAGLLNTILFASPDAAQLREAFGFTGTVDELSSLFGLMKSESSAVQALWGKWAQRLDQALWRFGYTLDYIAGDWVKGVHQRTRELRTICEPYRPAKQPTLRDISAVLSHGSQSMTPFIEYTPDGELYAVMRSFRATGNPPRSPKPAAEPSPSRRTDLVEPEPESGPALKYLLDYLDDLKIGKRQINDSSNAWWAVRIGICRRDARFRDPLKFVSERYSGDPIFPKGMLATDPNPMPEIYQTSVSTVSYTLSNAQAILECNHDIEVSIQNRLHEVIANMRERLLATPVSPNLYLASVHQEGLRNYLDYLNDQGITVEP